MRTKKKKSISRTKNFQGTLVTKLLSVKGVRYNRIVNFDEFYSLYYTHCMEAKACNVHTMHSTRLSSIECLCVTIT